MRANSTQHFRRGIVGKLTRLQPRRGFSRAGAVQISRHLRWTLAITNRLVRRGTWRGIHPQNMMLRVASPSWILIRKVTSRSSSFVTFVLSPLSARRDRPAAYRLADASEGKRRLLNLPLTLNEALGTVPTILPRVQDRTHTSMMTMFSRLVCAREYALRSLIREPLWAASAGKNSPLSFASTLVHPAIRPQPSRGAEVAPEREDIPAQVRRRHRRMEQRHFLRVHDDAHEPPPVQLAKHPDVVRKSWSRVPERADDQATIESGSRGRVARSDPPVNIAQITDAVLQQLDRRMVAARERMGRI